MSEKMTRKELKAPDEFQKIGAQAVPLLVQHQKTLVIGTTGHTDTQISTIRHAASQIPIVFAPNYSIGVNTLFWLTRKAAGKPVFEIAQVAAKVLQIRAQGRTDRALGTDEEWDK